MSESRGRLQRRRVCLGRCAHHFSDHTPAAEPRIPNTQRSQGGGPDSCALGSSIGESWSTGTGVGSRGRLSLSRTRQRLLCTWPCAAGSACGSAGGSSRVSGHNTVLPCASTNICRSATTTETPRPAQPRCTATQMPSLRTLSSTRRDTKRGTLPQLQQCLRTVADTCHKCGIPTAVMRYAPKPNSHRNPIKPRADNGIHEPPASERNDDPVGCAGPTVHAMREGGGVCALCGMCAAGRAWVVRGAGYVCACACACGACAARSTWAVCSARLPSVRDVPCVACAIQATPAVHPLSVCVRYAACMERM